MTNKLLISSCLLGHPVRFDGQSKGMKEIDWLQQLQQQGLLFNTCPEVKGGLPTPRPPAEIQNDKVIAVSGQDVTSQFKAGAEHTLNLCKTHGIRFALLKAKSPSCGNRQIYDGSYSGRLVDGQGITAKLLLDNGIRVYSELEIEQLKYDMKANN